MMPVMMKNTTAKASQVAPQVTKNHSNHHQQMLSSFFGLLRSAANSLGEEIHKLGEAAKRGFADTSLYHMRGGGGGAIPAHHRIAAAAEGDDEEVMIVFQDKQHFMIEPEILLFPSQRQDLEMFPTLQLLQAQKVKVLNPFDAVLSVFRQQLVEDKTNNARKQQQLLLTDTTTSTQQQQRKVVVSPKRKRIVRPLKKLISSEEVKRRLAIERKLSMIRKGRFAVPASTTTNGFNNHHQPPAVLLSTY